MGLSLSTKGIFGIVVAVLISACNNEGEIKFHDGASTSSRGVTSLSITPGAQALAVESGKTKATGYHARLELNTIQGQKVQSNSGYSVRLGVKRNTDSNSNQ